jgi:hypothetical protein
MCQEVLDGDLDDPAFHAKVNIMIRRQPTPPAQMFATITFFNRLLPDNPAETEAVNTSNVSISAFDGNIDINPPQWELQLQKTTVLLRSP